MKTKIKLLFHNVQKYFFNLVFSELGQKEIKLKFGGML